MMQNKNVTLIQVWLWFVSRLVGWSMMGCVGCVCVAMLIIALNRETLGFTKLNILINENYQYVTSFINPNALATLNKILQRIPTNITQPDIKLSMMNMHKFTMLWTNIIPFIDAALLGVKLLILRLYLLFHWSFLFLLLGFVGLTDGVMQRSIRRMAAGRESALIYHHIKSWVSVSFILSTFMVLVLPISVVYSEWVLVIASLMFALTMQMTTQFFKKYL